MDFWLALKSGFGFLSTIPFGITMEGIDALMKKLYLYTIIGSFLGVIIGAVGLAAEWILPTPLTAVLIIGCIYYLTWFNHMDGIADMGDGMTAHGSVEKKRKALKDMSLGVGGAAFVALAVVFLYASLITLEKSVSMLFESELIQNSGRIFTVFAGTLTKSAPVTIALSLIVSEMNAKQSMLTIATLGKPFQEGLGAMTIRGATKKNWVIGTVYAYMVSILLLGAVGAIATTVSMAGSLWVLHTNNRHFGGLNGDGIGTANETGRIVSILAIAVVYYFLAKGGASWMLS